MLIAVSGLAGVGKTTAVEHLQATGVGRMIYVGGLIREEVCRRKLSETPENEQLVRVDMRQRIGRDALAQMVISSLGGGMPRETLLLDAICLREEAECYRRNLGLQLVILGLEAKFEVRAARLECRVQRPLTRDELRDRDNFECSNLKLNDVIASADHRLTNEGNLESFRRALDALSAGWPRGA